MTRLLDRGRDGGGGGGGGGGGEYDLAVVGAGPAGAAAALAALATSPDARVLLLDRADFPRDKPCGDGVAPHAWELLDRLGAPAAQGGAPAVHRLRLGFRDGPEVVGTMARPARVVARYDLDARLVAAAVARGAELVRHRVRRVEVDADGVVLDGELAARTVVAADGAHSTLRRALGIPANPPGRVAVALRGYAPVGAQRAGEQVIVFGAARWPAYAWSFPLGNGRANVGYGETLAGSDLTRDRLLERLEELLPGATEGGTQWRAHHLPMSSGRPRQPDGRVLLAGDAMSLVNPMTGEGIYYAVLSGALAGRAAVGADANPGRAYRRALDRRLGRHLRHTAAAARLARSPRLVHAAVRAAGRDRRAFDDLVELGLGAGLVTPRLAGGLARAGRPGGAASRGTPAAPRAGSGWSA